jgi:DNA replication protein DnaC
MTNPSDESKSDGKIIDFDWCVKFFEKRGQEMYGPNFRIIQEDHEIIYKLVVYFLGHEDEANRLGLDLRKGIMLTGPIGCGKTSLMSLMRLVPAKERNFAMKTTRDISFEFIQEGYDVINRYSKLSFTGAGPRIYCFDDLGAEQNLKYYGNSCNVMGEILLSRYDLFNSQGMVSHLTTNLGAAEIEKFYGTRLRSRMREMFNSIPFLANSTDKRT